MSDPSKMMWKNLDSYYESKDPATYLHGKPTNMACHNIYSNTKAPMGIEHLLGLGAKHCVKRTKLTDKSIDDMMDRL